MAKGKHIPERLKRIIAKVYIAYPKMPAKDIRWEAHNIYRREHPNIREDWPGLSAVQKILQKIRLEQLPNPKDEPWSLYTLADYDIPADALQPVLNAYALTLAFNLKPLTIREAQWVARLYKVITNYEDLTVASKLCAENERINDAMGKPSPGLVDADIQTRALKNKPGISYSIEDKGYQASILDEAIEENLELTPLPKRLRK